MKIPKYWAKSGQTVRQPNGRAIKLEIWQWSDISQEQAQQKATERVAEVAQKVSTGAQLNRYAYGERPLREEITQGVANAAGSEVAVVTRNLYGALVLNAANAMFVDIDFPDKGTSGSSGGLSRLFGKPAINHEDQHVQRIMTWAVRYPDLGIRIYRTAGGLRCLFTNQVFDPGRAETTDILRALDSDPLYVRLCQAQACFRARLTPKPWRCDLPMPPSRYPWVDFVAETRYREWVQRYEQRTPQYAVCRLVKQLGPQEVHPDVQPVLTLHDRLTCSDYAHQLA